MTTTRWAAVQLPMFPDYLRNDAEKFRNAPGMLAGVERMILAADLLEAVIAMHAGCAVSVCPTKQAMHRALEDSE